MAYSMYERGQGGYASQEYLGAIPVAAAVGAIGGLFGGGGADPKKYAERQARIDALRNEARNGGEDAWLLLGAYGGVAPLPRVVHPASHPEVAAGFIETAWGSAYNKIKQRAATEYRALQPQFAVAQQVAPIGGNAAAPPVQLTTAGVAGGLPITTLLLVGGVLAVGLAMGGGGTKRRRR
jgi:hypothetical protein